MLVWIWGRLENGVEVEVVEVVVDVELDDEE